jgi:hypothetical protein
MAWPFIDLGCSGSCLNRSCGGANHLDDTFRLGEHWHVAAVKLIGGCSHALGHGAFQIGLNRAVFLADDVPAWLRLPGGSSGLRLEQIGFGDTLSRPNELLLLLRKISAEILRAFRTKPDTSIYDFDVGEDISLREVRLLCLRGLIGVRSERADVHQPGNSIVDSGASDDGSTVGVADKDNRAADPTDGCFR